MNMNMMTKQQQYPLLQNQTYQAQSKPDLRAEMQITALENVLAKRFAGQSGYQLSKNYPVSSSFDHLPTEYVGAVTDKESGKDQNFQKQNDIVKQFRFNSVKWFGNNSCFALGYNKNLAGSKKQGFFSVFDIHQWNLRYTRFSPEEAMVGLEKMDHLNRILGFGSNGGIYSIASGQEQQNAQPFENTHIEAVTEGWFKFINLSNSFSPNQSKFVFSSEKKNVYIVDLQKPKEHEPMSGHCKEVHTCHWNPVYSLILSGSEDQTIRIWDANKKEELANMKRHNLGVIKVRWSLNGMHFLTSGKERRVYIFDLRNYETEIHEIKSEEQFDAILWHPFYENIFLTGDRFGTISYWNLDCPSEPIFQIIKKNTQINDLAIDNTGQFLACIRGVTDQKDSRELFKRQTQFKI